MAYSLFHISTFECCWQTTKQRYYILLEIGKIRILSYLKLVCKIWHFNTQILKTQRRMRSSLSPGKASTKKKNLCCKRHTKPLVCGVCELARTTTVHCTNQIQIHVHTHKHSHLYSMQHNLAGF